MRSNSTSSVIVPAALEPLEAAASREGVAPVAARLAELRAWLESDLSELEAFIPKPGEDPQFGSVGRAMKNLLRAPGKRLRPICVMLAARLGGRDFDAPVRKLAVAVELVHAATLLHDDVIDEGVRRRGRLSSALVFGNSASVLAGDGLFTHALRLICEAGVPEQLPEMIEVISEMVLAEAIQLDLRGRFEPDRERVLEVIDGKTAALFRWAFGAGAAAGGLPAAQRTRLQEAGRCLGLAFQLADDIIDVVQDPADSGKTALADLRQGKMTWPLIEAVERDEGLTSLIRQALAEDSAELTAEIRDRVLASGAIEATRAFAMEHAERALAILQELPDSKAAEALRALVVAAVHRHF